MEFHLKTSLENAKFRKQKRKGDSLDSSMSSDLGSITFQNQPSGPILLHNQVHEVDNEADPVDGSTRNKFSLGHQAFNLTSSFRNVNFDGDKRESCPFAIETPKHIKDNFQEKSPEVEVIDKLDD